MPTWFTTICAAIFSGITLGALSSVIVTRWGAYSRLVRLSLAVLAVVTGLVALRGMTVEPPNTNPVLSAYEVARQELRCGDEFGPEAASLEGSLGVRNLSRGDSDYESFVTASTGDELEFRMYIRSLEPHERLARNIHARLGLDESAVSQVHLVLMDACGSNTVLLRDAVTVRTEDVLDGTLTFVPGSVEVSMTVDGRRTARSATDDFVLAKSGESLGSLRATLQENDFYVLVKAKVGRSAQGRVGEG